MASQEQKTWTCDRCGLQQVEPLREPDGSMKGPPTGWQHIEVRWTYAPAGDLCDHCDNEYAEWWRSLAGGAQRCVSCGKPIVIPGTNSPAHPFTDGVTDKAYCSNCYPRPDADGAL